MGKKRTFQEWGWLCSMQLPLLVYRLQQCDADRHVYILSFVMSQYNCDCTVRIALSRTWRDTFAVNIVAHDFVTSENMTYTLTDWDAPLASLKSFALDLVKYNFGHFASTLVIPSVINYQTATI